MFAGLPFTFCLVSDITSLRGVAIIARITNQLDAVIIGICFVFMIEAVAIVSRVTAAVLEVHLIILREGFKELHSSGVLLAWALHCTWIRV